MDQLSLRPAVETDEAFLEALFGDVRRDEFAAAGLPDAQLGPLLAMQYRAQKQSYEWSFPQAENAIIETGGAPVGRLLTTKTAEALQLHDVSLLREARNRGFGGRLIESLQRENRVVRLRVFKTNAAAVRFYARHGFETVADDGTYLEMEWKNA